MNRRADPPAVTRPGNCALGFGIPLTEEAFRSAVLRGGGPPRSFAEQFDGSLALYRHQVIDPCTRFAARFARLGVRVVCDLTLAGYSALFGGAGVRAVILFSHFADDAVELGDGFADTDAMVRATPEDFTGCLDLSICHPRALVAELRQRRPRCDLKWLSCEVTPAVWLYYFWRLFGRLQRRPASYLDDQVDLLRDVARAGDPAAGRWR